ncbi:MAG TPA: FtsX-like permease family protein [Anaerolineales bacterium]|nr:FtsX-like permease family protein [Anaerolineales bacterium]
MREIIKAFLKSLIERKARTFLVLFSIAVSAALIFANESFSQTVRQKVYDADVRWSGNSDLYVSTKETVGAEEWIDTEKLLSGYADSFEYVFQFIREKALYMPSLEQMHYFTLLGVNMDELNQFNPVTLSDGSFEDWEGFNIVVGRAYANEYQFKVNDVIKLELNNAEYDFKIVGISEPRGLFLRELADGGYMLAPKDTISEIFGGNSNLVFLKLKDSSQVAAMKERLTRDFTGYEVKYGVNDAVIDAETQNYVMPFRLSTITVLFMCVFIIYTAFHLVTLERIPIVGTLRSIGCTRRMINLILIMESAGLGLVGGLIGCILGFGVIQYIKYSYTTVDEALLNTAVVFGVREIFLAVGAAVVITTLTAILPILRLTNTPIKNIILNDLGKKQGRKTSWWIAGVLLLAACAFVPQFLGSNFIGMVVGGVLATGALIGLIPLVPFLTHHASRLVEETPFLSHEIVLGLRNIRDNRSLMNNIQLFSVAIAIVAFMVSLFNTMGADLRKAFERQTYDVRLVLRHSDEASLAKLAQVEGVESFAGSYETHAELVNYQTFLNVLCGIENEDFFDFNSVDQLDANRAALANLDKGKYVITTNVLKSKLNLKLGETMLIKFGSQEVPYTITGFVETNLGIGHVAFISANNYREDMGVSDYSFVYIKAQKDADELRNNILRVMNKDVMEIFTHEEWTSANADKVFAIFNAISSYGYFALLVGIIGIVNNLAVSFIERQRNFAMVRCIGMSKKGLNRMLITESIAMGILGVGFGVLCTLVMSSTIPVTVSLMWGKVIPQLAVKEMAIMGVVGILAMLAIAFVPILRSEKLSLIETIKYE